jgi:acyl carrier protein
MTKLYHIIEKNFSKSLEGVDIMQLKIGSFPEWDSLSHFSLLVSIEETYHIQFTLDEISELKTIEKIIVSLREKGISDIF